MWSSLAAETKLACSYCWHKTHNQTPINNKILMLIFQICSPTPSVAFLSSSLKATPDSVHMFCLFKNTCFLLSFPLLSFPFLSSRTLSVILSLSPSFLPAHFLPSRPLAYSHFHTISPALLGDACHFSCGFLTPAQDMKGLFCVYGRMGTERRGEGGKKERVRWMFAGSLRKSWIVWFQFGVNSSWKEISDFCLLTLSSLCVRERRRSDRSRGGLREGWRGVDVRIDTFCLLDRNLTLLRSWDVFQTFTQKY